MREDKKLITQEYVERLKNSPYFIVVNYEGLKVDEFEELRNRLADCNSELHVVKNSIFKIAAQETGVEDLGQPLARGRWLRSPEKVKFTGAAKVLKNFAAEFEKPEWHFGFLDNERLDADQIKTLADLPSLDELRAKILGTIQAPASKLVRTFNEPGSSLARVIRAKFVE